MNMVEYTWTPRRLYPRLCIRLRHSLVKLTFAAPGNRRSYIKEIKYLFLNEKFSDLLPAHYFATMSRHRITILNHESDHDSIIRSMNSTVVDLNPKTPYTREEKLTIDFKNRFKYVKNLRILTGHHDSELFHYNTVGLSIYAIPATNNKQQFFGEINHFINNLFDVEISDSNWILSKGSLLLHLNDYNLDATNKLFSGFLRSNVDTDTFDLLYEEDKLIVSFINNDKLPIEYDGEGYKEVGIFLIDSKSSSEDIILSGLRVVMGEVEEKDLYHKTLFHITPKYRPLEASSQIIKNGLHPKIKTELKTAPADVDVHDCKLYYYLNLDKLLFLDKYNLGENFKFILNFGNQDLELPEYKIDQWGNEILLEVEDPSKGIELNLHSRYQLPGTQSQKSLHIDSPVLFYGCEDSRDKNVLNLNPFLHNFAIGNKYENFFTNDTIFYESVSLDKLEISVPTPNKNFELINLITCLSLITGIIIILLQLLTTKPIQLKKKQ